VIGTMLSGRPWFCVEGGGKKRNGGDLFPWDERGRGGRGKLYVLERSQQQRLLEYREGGEEGKGELEPLPHRNTKGHSFSRRSYTTTLKKKRKKMAVPTRIFASREKEKFRASGNGLHERWGKREGGEQEG